ncbi:M28 family metallopeptidase [Planomonospora venezuelensis]|uniref:Aminopeptidase Y n=1 Tax=Planomonospora venezuelensis TaxID=1999 RepID=A0A841DGR8_PLAVE|nr:M28 family metallopeptidase [Planomonospora venezuelensis]MBB5967488.1 aminopeptidase Y [Planomonospora venezuelensis]GIN04469.1 aminopeptidase [Planomonospora venezuelensis]
MRSRAHKGLLAAVTAASALVLPVISATPASADPDPKVLSQTVKGPAAKRHLLKFQQIADANGGTRASGTAGYDASVAYVADRLRKAGYAVTLQEFEFPFFREITKSTLNRVAPSAKSYVRNTDFRVMTYSGSGSVTAAVQAVDVMIPPSPTPNTSTSGCEASDFAGFTAGNIALMQRGTCSFLVKAQNAVAAGAKGVIIFNEGQAGEGANDRRVLLGGTLGEPTVNIPVVGTTYATGEELAAAGTTVTLTTDTESDPHRKTHNILAESRWGDPSKVVMAGAHLDSVTEGPGINDNGSGSAGVLETALKANRFPTVNKLRFAFWGAEELGLLGSEHYVANLSAEEKAKIKLYLNFDMIASPNYVFGIYDGDDSDAEGAGPGPEGSDKIEKLFESYFKAVRQPYTGTDFTGRSDYGPFIEAGIPAGGLFTGAEGIKTAEEAQKFGGEAGVAYDKCYHLECDTIANVNDKALAVNTGAIATATFVYAYSRDLPGGGTPGSNQPGTGGGGHDHEHDHVGVPM